MLERLSIVKRIALSGKDFFPMHSDLYFSYNSSDLGGIRPSTWGIGANMRLDFEKLKASIHYICEKASADTSKLDSIKLNKVLWYSDCMAYLARGRPITGALYMRKQHGPVAKYNRLAIEALESEGALLRGKSSKDGAWPTAFDVIQEVDKSKLESEELSIIDSVFKHVCLESSSMGISEQSHGEIWKLAANDEVLPLFTVFAEGRGPIREEHYRAATADLK